MGYIWLPHAVRNMIHNRQQHQVLSPEAGTGKQRVLPSRAALPQPATRWGAATEPTAAPRGRALRAPTRHCAEFSSQSHQGER